MKKTLSTIALFSLSLLPLTAEQYVTLQAGPDYCYRTDNNERGQKVGYKIGGSYGYKFENGVRLDVELSYRDGNKRTQYVYVEGGDDSKTHVSNHSMSYLANVSYDIGSLQTYGVTPYVGIGIGLCSNTYKLKTKTGAITTNEDQGKDDRFAWQLIAGAKYPVGEKLALAAEYKYFVGAYHSKNHSFSAALVRSF